MAGGGGGPGHSKAGRPPCCFFPPQSEPLQSVADHMAAQLGVSPSRILLLFGETELSPTATPRTLKLGVADIIGERKAGRGALRRLLPQGGDSRKDPDRHCFQALLRPGFPMLPSTDCVVLAPSPDAAETSRLLQLRVQGKEKHQTLEVSLSPVSALSSAVLSVRCGWVPPCPDSVETLSSLVLASHPSWVVGEAQSSASLPTSALNF